MEHRLIHVGGFDWIFTKLMSVCLLEAQFLHEMGFQCLTAPF